MALIIIGIPVLDSVMSFWLQKLFNMVEPGANLLFVYRTIIAGFLVWIGKKLLYYVLAVLRERIICNAKYDVKHNMFMSMMKLDSSDISRIASSGEYISVFTNDINMLETRYYGAAVSLVSDICSIMILGSSFLILDLKLGAAVIVFGIIIMFVPMLFSKQLNKSSLAYADSVSEFTQRIKEYVTAYPTIKNYSVEDVMSGMFDQVSMDTENSKFAAESKLVLANNVGSMLSWFMQFFAIGLGVVMVVNGELSIGTVIAAKAFATSLADPLQNVIYDANSIRSVRDVVKRLARLSCADCTDKSSINVSENRVGTTVDKCDIRFDDVSLRLGESVIVDHFSYAFESGKKYLMVGLNGAGKSSVFKVLKKWYSDTTGDIYIGDRNLSDISGKELSALVSYMNESVSFFSGSVRENIALFREFPDVDINAAASGAQVRLDLGRDITDDGKNISSGERRRIEISRSLLSSAKVFIFDEVVSTLDIETAYEIERLALGFEDKTVIFISHNFSGILMRDYDEILVMSNGKLLAHGAYDELLKTCAYFKKICEIKFGKL